MAGAGSVVDAFLLPRPWPASRPCWWRDRRCTWACRVAGRLVDSGNFADRELAHDDARVAVGGMPRGFFGTELGTLGSDLFVTGHRGTLGRLPISASSISRASRCCMRYNLAVRYSRCLPGRGMPFDRVGAKASPSGPRRCFLGNNAKEAGSCTCWGTRSRKRPANEGSVAGLERDNLGGSLEGDRLHPARPLL